jgi:hypothetical protein
MITTRQFLLSSQITRHCASAIAANTSELFVGTSRFNVVGASCKLMDRRTMVSKPMAGSDPLDVLRQKCTTRKHCDDEGRRLKSTEHWTLSIAIASSDPNMVRFMFLICVGVIESALKSYKLLMSPVFPLYLNSRLICELLV